MISLSSVATAASTAASEEVRPTDKGISNPGNNTEFFNGSNGRMRIFSRSLIFWSPLFLFKMLQHAPPILLER